jgi:hypothetical protein
MDVFAASLRDGFCDEWKRAFKCQSRQLQRMFKNVLFAIIIAWIFDFKIVNLLPLDKQQSFQAVHRSHQKYLEDLI